MIKIEFKIPTSFKELKNMYKDKVSSRYKNNKKVFDILVNDICNELKNAYWNGDISEYMRKELTDYPKGKIYIIAKKHKQNIE